jgi:hypothetical protein
MNLYRVYTGYEGNSAIYYLVTAETPEYAELVAIKKATEDEAEFRLPMNAELIFDDLAKTNISEVSE